MSKSAHCVLMALAAFLKQSGLRVYVCNASNDIWWWLRPMLYDRLQWHVWRTQTDTERTEFSVIEQSVLTSVSGCKEKNGSNPPRLLRPSGMLVSTIVSSVCRGQETPRHSRGSINVSKTTKTCMMNTYWALTMVQVSTKERAGVQGRRQLSEARWGNPKYYYVAAPMRQRNRTATRSCGSKLSRLNGPTSYPDLSLSLVKINHMLPVPLLVHTSFNVQRSAFSVSTSTLTFPPYFIKALKLQPFETNPCSLCITWIILALNGFYGYWYGDVFLFFFLCGSYNFSTLQKKTIQ